MTHENESLGLIERMYAERLCTRHRTACLTTSHWVTDRFSLHTHLYLPLYLQPVKYLFTYLIFNFTLSRQSLFAGFWSPPLCQAGKVEREARKWSRAQWNRQQMKIKLFAPVSSAFFLCFYSFVIYWHQYQSNRENWDQTFYYLLRRINRTRSDTDFLTFINISGNIC